MVWLTQFFSETLCFHVEPYFVHPCWAESVHFHIALGCSTHSLRPPFTCFTVPQIFFSYEQWYVHFKDKTPLITSAKHCDSSTWPYSEKNLSTGLIQNSHLIPTHSICPSSQRHREERHPPSTSPTSCLQWKRRSRAPLEGNEPMQAQLACLQNMLKGKEKREEAMHFYIPTSTV